MFGAIASIAGPLIGGLVSGSATNSAANTQADATRMSTAEMQREYDLTRSDQAPYRAAGSSAISRLQAILGIGDSGRMVMPDGTTLDDAARNKWTSDWNNDVNGLRTVGNASPDVYQSTDPSGYASAMSGYKSQLQPQATTNPDFGSLNKKFSIADFWNDPVVQASYQSGLDLGTKALKNAAPLTTGLDSGAALKELTKFGTDYTGNMAAGSQQRYVGDQNNTFNRLMGIVNGGQVATQATDNAGMQTAANIGNATTALGNAQGAAKIAGANSFGSGLSSVSNFYNQQQLINSLRGNSGFTPSNYNTSFIGPNGYNPQPE